MLRSTDLNEAKALLYELGERHRGVHFAHEAWSGGKIGSDYGSALLCSIFCWPS